VPRRPLPARGAREAATHLQATQAVASFQQRTKISLGGYGAAKSTETPKAFVPADGAD
jgi:hypothetical protein